MNGGIKMRRMLRCLYLLPFLTVFIIIGCSNEAITDTKSKQIPMLPIDKLESNMTIIDVYTDAMQRDGNFPPKVVVDTSIMRIKI